MDQVALASNNDRKELFEQTAVKMGLNPVLLEKDFWVCWILEKVYSLDDQPPLIFKGGTSLSKGYGLIQRFSEDVDLAFDRTFFGEAPDLAQLNKMSGKNREEYIKRLSSQCTGHIADNFHPALSATVSKTLTEPFELTISKDDSQAILFKFPPSLSPDEYGAAAYIAPSVLLELGSRSDHLPSEVRTIRPYAADHFPEAFTNPGVDVPTLAATRTFFEKATLLHQNANRPDFQPRHAERHSRHYHDLFMLNNSPTKKEALKDIGLLKRVAEHKHAFFRSGWTKYPESATGNLKLIPEPSIVEMLGKDYDKMNQMLFGEIPAFETIMADLSRLEKEINALALKKNAG